MIASGHDFNQIQYYTARQITLFYQQSILRERRLRAARTVDVAYGVNGGKEVTGYLNDLTST
ncbi:hypothetical protein [[Haemophilus] ducreyi]|uniref:hypothetical protein n=1 Tax=Haemophilus ducreyi TaxID=730 RepID=UPI0008D37CBA|nr:hypothetical protein [[Haemophilus] ducreyi]SEV92894.1 hypothetical protein SAMN02983000_0812 [[Haemophilus] ducreyi]SEW10736.1 hypothetical protein SAMN02983000_1390 [[Haemophilus] ducreyi]SEW16920.1 hypothetical protein SAMN02983000_0003 [[Haemophilus] ducreyi]